MKDLFISYAHQDSATAQRLATLLEASGLTVWWDPQLRAGQDFAQEIERVLQQVRCVIVLWSAHSVGSRWVRAEANEGLRLGKLVPVALDDSTPPLVFRAIHTAQLETDQLDAGGADVRKLIEDLRAFLGRTIEAPTVDGRAPPYPWYYPAAIAGTVGVTLLLMALSAIPAGLLDWLTGTLAASPLRLAPAVTESLLLSAALMLLLAGGRRLHLSRFRNMRWIAVVLPATLICAICVYTWGARWLNPAADHLSGKVVVAKEWNDMRIVALDALNQPISLGEVPVSTENGEFGMRLHSSFFDRPRSLKLIKPGCADAINLLPWQQWKKRASIIVAFQCKPGS